MRGYRVVENVEAFITRYCFKNAPCNAVVLPEYQAMLEPMFLAAKLSTNPSTTRVGVALSGGPDSMALLGLTVAALGRDRVVALTVIHGPPEDDGEPSSMIQDLVRPLGVQHRILVLNNVPSAINGQTADSRKADKHIPNFPTFSSKRRVQQQLREARYAALRDVALDLELPLILCGHHLDDDLCTYFMRLSRYSGIEGLAGMRPLSILAGTPITASQFRRLENSTTVGSSPPLMLGRPLLGCPKGRLVHTCGKLGLAFLEDPYNCRSDSSLRNFIRDGIQVLLREDASISIGDLYALMSSAKRHREELRRQLQIAVTENLFAATESKENASWPWTSGQLAASPSAVVALPLHQHWWRNSGLLMRVLSIAAEGVGGTHLASSQTTLLAFSEAIVASALILVRQTQRRRPQHMMMTMTIPPSSASYRHRVLLGDAPTQQANDRSEIIHLPRIQKLPFIRAFSFGRCVVSPLGAIEASRRGLTHAGGPLLGITPAPRISEYLNTSSIAPERRMVDNLLMEPGRVYLWDGRIQLYLSHEQQTVRFPLQVLSERKLEETRPGPLTGIFARAGGLPAIRVGQRTFQEPPMLWILSPTLGPAGPKIEKTIPTQAESDIDGDEVVPLKKATSMNDDNATSTHHISGSMVRIVPLTLAALRWFAAGAARREPEKLDKMEAIRQCHTADALLQHPLVIAMDGSWAVMPTLSLTLGHGPGASLVRAMPVGITHLVNRVLLPSVL